jgi:predicted phosphodiesterase
MNREILEYCLERKPKYSTTPSWQELADEILEQFGEEVSSIAGLRSRVAEYRSLKNRQGRFIPGTGFVVPNSETWGDGVAPLVEVTTKDLFETVISISDIHFPYHSKNLLESTLLLIASINPDVIVINGDVNDFFQLSRFNQGLERLDDLQEEIDMGVQFRQTLRELVPNAVIRENLGNHDERILSYIENNARSLSSLRALKPESLLGLDELEITLFGRAGHRIRPEFVFEHGHVVRGEAGASAKARLTNTLISGMMGHTHRMAEYPKFGYRNLTWYEQGCLCLRNAEYKIGETNWQPGIAVGHFSTKTDNYHVELVRAVHDGYIYGGDHYGNIYDEELIPA